MPPVGTRGVRTISQTKAVADLAPADPNSAVPLHVAIIMDGNGRWAEQRSLPRVAGHRAGVQAVRRTIEAAIAHGVSWLTLYAFSSENWRRPAQEVTDLTGLLRRFIKSEIAEMNRNGVRMHVIGDRSRFDRDIQTELARAEETTRANTKLNLVIALSYGARSEIVAAAQQARVLVDDGDLVRLQIRHRPGDKVLQGAHLFGARFTADHPDDH